MRTLNTFIGGLALCSAISTAQAAAVKVTVTSPHDVTEVPVSILVPEAVAKAPTPLTGITPVAGQMEDAGNGQVRVTFIARNLKAGEKRAYLVDTLTPIAPTNGVELKRNGENVDFLVNGKLFTRYDVTTGPTKPYFYPVFAPGEKQVVRRWPVEKTEGGTKDHPHHRGLWFTHGKVNGADFWLETGKAGKTVHTAYETVQSGPLYGLMRTKTDWIKPDGVKIAEDSREVRVYNLSSGYMMDFAVTLKAVGGPLVLGDTKEGTLALRLADSMRAKVEKDKTAEGHILNSNGVKDGATWGKSAAWVSYYGPVDGQTVGVAIFDDPKNPRHPTTWHVRDYGLFAANPFGLHDFDKKNAPNSGDLTVPENESVTFRYRLFFHTGTPEEANISAIGQVIATPPIVAAN